jgi:hypothetical protein
MEWICGMAGEVRQGCLSAWLANLYVFLGGRPIDVRPLLAACPEETTDWGCGDDDADGWC